MAPGGHGGQRIGTAPAGDGRPHGQPPPPLGDGVPPRGDAAHRRDRRPRLRRRRAAPTRTRSPGSSRSTSTSGASTSWSSFPSSPPASGSPRIYVQATGTHRRDGALPLHAGRSRTRASRPTAPSGTSPARRRPPRRWRPFSRPAHPPTRSTPWTTARRGAPGASASRRSSTNTASARRRWTSRRRRGWRSRRSRSRTSAATSPPTPPTRRGSASGCAPRRRSWCAALASGSPTPGCSQRSTSALRGRPRRLAAGGGPRLLHRPALARRRDAAGVPADRHDA